MKKILLALLVLCITGGMSFAYMTVEQARSKEQLMNEGFSEQTAVMIQKEAGEYNVKPTNKWQKVGFKFWNYIDPMSPQARDEEPHQIKMYPAYSDL